MNSQSTPQALPPSGATATSPTCAQPTFYNTPTTATDPTRLHSAGASSNHQTSLQSIPAFPAPTNAPPSAQSAFRLTTLPPGPVTTNPHPQVLHTKNHHGAAPESCNTISTGDPDSMPSKPRKRRVEELERDDDEVGEAPNPKRVRQHDAVAHSDAHMREGGFSAELGDLAGEENCNTRVGDNETSSAKETSSLPNLPTQDSCAVLASNTPGIQSSPDSTTSSNRPAHEHLEERIKQQLIVIAKLSSFLVQLKTQRDAETHCGDSEASRPEFWRNKSAELEKELEIQIGANTSLETEVVRQDIELSRKDTTIAKLRDSLKTERLSQKSLSKALVSQDIALSNADIKISVLEETATKQRKGRKSFETMFLAAKTAQASTEAELAQESIRRTEVKNNADIKISVLEKTATKERNGRKTFETMYFAAKSRQASAETKFAKESTELKKHLNTQIVRAIKAEKKNAEWNEFYSKTKNHRAAYETSRPAMNAATPSVQQEQVKHEEHTKENLRLRARVRELEGRLRPLGPGASGSGVRGDKKDGRGGLGGGRGDGREDGRFGRGV